MFGSQYFQSIYLLQDWNITFTMWGILEIMNKLILDAVQLVQLMSESSTA